MFEVTFHPPTPLSNAIPGTACKDHNEFLGTEAFHLAEECMFQVDIYTQAIYPSEMKVPINIFHNTVSP